MVSESEGGLSGLWTVSLLLFINVVSAFGAVKVQVAGVVWGCVLSFGFQGFGKVGGSLWFQLS